MDHKPLYGPCSPEAKQPIRQAIEHGEHSVVVRRVPVLRSKGKGSNHQLHIKRHRTSHGSSERALRRLVISVLFEAPPFRLHVRFPGYIMAAFDVLYWIAFILFDSGSPKYKSFNVTPMANGKHSAQCSLNAVGFLTRAFGGMKHGW